MIESRYDDAFLYLNTHCKKRSLVVLVTNVIDEVNAHQVESYMRNLSGRHLPLGVILRDHRLFDAADREPASDEQLYEAAAASEILTWRQLKFHHKPIGMLNVAGFFDPLLAWIDKSISEDFVKAKGLAERGSRDDSHHNRQRYYIDAYEYEQHKRK